MKPSSRARWAMIEASCGFLMPPPTTELMLTWKYACFASSSNFLSRTFKLFIDTSSGCTLSMLI